MNVANFEFSLRKRTPVKKRMKNYVLILTPSPSYMSNKQLEVFQISEDQNTT